MSDYYYHTNSNTLGVAAQSQLCESSLRLKTQFELIMKVMSCHKLLHLINIDMNTRHDFDCQPHSHFR